MNDMKPSSDKQVVQFSFDKPILNFGTSSQDNKSTSFTGEKKIRHTHFSLSNKPSKLVSFDRHNHFSLSNRLNNINKAVKKRFVHNERKVVCFSKDWKLVEVKQVSAIEQYLRSNLTPRMVGVILFSIFVTVLTGIYGLSLLPSVYDMLRRRFNEM